MNDQILYTMDYSLFYFTFFLISFVTLFNRSQLKQNEFTPSVFAFMVEFTKALIMFLYLKYHLKVNELNLFSIHTKEYTVVAILYFMSNVLLYSILSKMSAGTFLVLSQHRIFIVLLLSMFVLKKTYTLEQKTACLVNFIGIVFILDSKFKHESDIWIYLMVLVHGIIGAFASVYIQKTMQSTPKNVESYCKDALRLYVIGLPVYGIWILLTVERAEIPNAWTTVVMVLFTAIQGIFIGTIFKYYSALHRTIMQGMVLVVVIGVSKMTIDNDEVLEYSFYFGALLIIMSIVIFTTKRIEYWMILVLLLYFRPTLDMGDYNLNNSTHVKYCVAVHKSDSSRQTKWIQNRVDTKFITFSYNCKDCNTDFVLDNNKKALDRTLSMLKTVTELYECQYVIKLDDDVDYYHENLNLNSKINYGGFLMKSNTGRVFASGGAGYVLDGSIAKELSYNCKINYDMEDVGIAECLYKHFKIVPEEIKGFNPDTPEQMLNWRKNPSFDHISKFDHNVNPITFHYVKNTRLSNGIIPKRYHVIWFGDEKRSPLEAIKNCKEIHNDWEFYFWTDRKIKQHKFESKYQRNFYTQKLCDKSDLLCRTDLLRLEILYLYGGIYVDADSICQKSFNGLELDGIDLFAAFENEFGKSQKNLVANGVLGASQYNPDLFALLSRLEEIKIGTPWQTTGPCLVTESLFNLESRICPKNAIGFVGGQSRNAKIFSSRLFFPLHHSGFKGPGNRKEVMKNAFTVQLWGSTKGVYNKLMKNAIKTKTENFKTFENI